MKQKFIYIDEFENRKQRNQKIAKLLGKNSQYIIINET